ncbi:MAG TPA: DoxX family protein [Archangium sp.]
MASSRGLSIGLWIAQVLLALTFVGGGVWKLMTPVETVAPMMPWAGELPALFRFTGVIDLLGGLGVLLPSLTRIKPRLTVLAALGCALLMLAAIGFHFSRGEAANTPFNFVLLGLSLFVAWGREKRAPITPRPAA